MKHIRFTLAPLALAITPYSFAADDIKRLPTEIVITASRSLKPVSEALDSATVITRADIERQQAASLADLLSQATGISLPSTGGPLTSTGIFLRGFKSNQVLVLVDGVRLNDANAGQFDFSALRPDDIDRIEVVRGGYSSQYGSDAMGGVIQIFTRKDAGSSVSMRAGSYGTLEGSVRTGRQHATGNFSLALTQLDTQGFSAGNRHYVAANGNYGFDADFNAFPIAPSPDRDGGRQRGLQASGRQQLNSSNSLDGSLLLKRQFTEFDDGTARNNLTAANLQLNTTFSPSHEQRILLGHTRTLQNTEGSTMGFPFNQRFDTQRVNADIVNTIRTSRLGTITAGLVMAREQTRAPAVDRDLSSQAVFLIHEQRMDRLSFRLSGRHERHEQWGIQQTGSVRIGYAVTQDADVFIGHGKNFRAPTAGELFDSTFGSNNPNLAPEHSRQNDLGVIWRHMTGHELRLTAFRSDVRNLIGFNKSFMLENLKEATLEGLEIELKGRQGDWSYLISGLRARNQDGDGNALPRRPTHQLSGNIGYQIRDDLSVGLQGLSRGSVRDQGFDANFTAIRMDTAGFAVANAYLQWRALRQLDLGLRLDNLANKTYELANGYNTPGRSGYITATYRF